MTIVQQTLSYILRSLPFIALIVTFFCINSLGAKGRRNIPAMMEVGGTEQRKEIQTASVSFQ